jgi:hypothetical protein
MLGCQYKRLGHHREHGLGRSSEGIRLLILFMNLSHYQRLALHVNPGHGKKRAEACGKTFQTRYRIWGRIPQVRRRRQRSVGAYLLFAAKTLSRLRGLPRVPVRMWETSSSEMTSVRSSLLAGVVHMNNIMPAPSARHWRRSPLAYQRCTHRCPALLDAHSGPRGSAHQRQPIMKTLPKVLTSWRTGVDGKPQPLFIAPEKTDELRASTPSHVTRQMFRSSCPPE